MWIEFRHAMERFRVFSSRDIQKMFPGLNGMNLVRWQHKGYLIKIINGWYCFSERFSGENISWLAANLIYSPSYLSLETALSYYNLIPEAVYPVTSVSTRKTNRFHTPIGDFHYQTVKASLYGFGQRLIKTGSAESARKILIAEPEKAILDFFYLNYQYKSEKDMEALRFDRDLLADIDAARLYSYLDRFKSEALNDRIFKLIKAYSIP